MSIFHQFREILQQRLQAILWRSVASGLETDAALQEIDNLDRVEERARQLESEGKSHLAELLRTRAARIDSDSPGGTIDTAVQRLGRENGSNLQLLGDQRGEQHEPTSPSATQNGRGKRRRRRVKTDESEHPE